MYRLPASIRDSAIRLLPRISYPFGEIRGNNLFDSHIRHPGTVRGDSYYIRIIFVLSKDRLRASVAGR